MEEQKRCSTCERWLPLCQFCKDKSKKIGLTSQCKICKRKYYAKYYDKNRNKILKHSTEYNQKYKEQVAKRHAKYYKKNKKIILQNGIKYRQDNKKRKANYDIEYRKNNKKRIRERNIKYYQAHKDERAEYRKNDKEKAAKRYKKYCQNNKEKMCVLWAKRRVIKKDQTPNNTKLAAILLYYAICSETNEILGDTFFHVDHIQPLSKGGLHHEDNLQILEVELNLQKSDKWPLTNDEQIKYRGITL